MSDSNNLTDSLVAQAEAALQSCGENSGSPSLDELITQIQSAITESPDTGKTLGPLLAKLRAAKRHSAATPIDWVPVLDGQLAIGHRPKFNAIKNMRNLGATHILTLLSESEGAQEIGDEARRAGLGWLWLPMQSGDPPADERLGEIRELFANLRTALTQHAHIYIHCSAGIHRTGMITYALLRFLQFTDGAALSTLLQLRQVTADGVGDERKHWGEQFA